MLEHFRENRRQLNPRRRNAWEILEKADGSRKRREKKKRKEGKVDRNRTTNHRKSIGGKDERSMKVSAS